MKKIVYFLLIMFCLSNTVLHANPLATVSAAKKNVFTKPASGDSTLILIPFDYKQSALFHQFTFVVIDSVVNLLLKDTGITLTINGYAHQDEGSDTICKYLSLNRALFVRDYILGRGIGASRIILVQGMGKTKSKNSDVNKDGHKLNCKAELRLNFPPPPKPVTIPDTDEDGIPDNEDACINEFGYKENKGCPDTNAIVIPFEFQVSSLSSYTYKALDSVITVLKENPGFNIAVQGHAYKEEGASTVCERLATERALIVKSYLMSRNIPVKRIVSLEGFGSRRPYNAGKNPVEIAMNARAQIIIER